MLVNGRVSKLNIYPRRPHHVKNEVTGTFAVETTTLQPRLLHRLARYLTGEARPEGKRSTGLCDFPGVLLSIPGFLKQKMDHC